MHIVALLIESNAAIAATQMNKLNDIFCISLGWLRGTQRQFSENICSENDLRSRIFGTFFVKFLACLPLLGFSNI